MAVQRILRGNGITQRAQLALAGPYPDWRDALRAAHAASDFNAFLEEIESEAQSIIDAAELTAKGDGPAVDVPDDSPEDYALRVLRYVELIRGAKRRGKSADLEILQLGRLDNEIKMKQAFERPALIGLKLCDSGRSGGETSAILERRKKSFQRYCTRTGILERRPNSRQSNTALMTEIGAKFGLGRSSSVEAIKRGLKELSG